MSIWACATPGARDQSCRGDNGQGFAESAATSSSVEEEMAPSQVAGPADAAHSRHGTPLIAFGMCKNMCGTVGRVGLVCMKLGQHPQVHTRSQPSTVLCARIWEGEKQEELKFRVILSYKVTCRASLSYIDWSS